MRFVWLENLPENLFNNIIIRNSRLENSNIIY